MNDNTNPTTPDVSNITAAVDTVSKLLAAGLIDASQFGLNVSASNPPDHRATDETLPTWVMVPGTPITVSDLVDKTLVSLKPSTARTYGSYLRLLARGYSDKFDTTLTHPGLGDKLAHEVLPSELTAMLKFVERRAKVYAERRAERRHSVGRATRESDGSGACYKAVGAWRAAFEVAVRDRHLARQFNPAQEIKKPKRSTGKRRPLKSEQMEDFWNVVRCTGDDPEPDWMIALTILITGCRREGLSRLTLGWTDRDQCTVKLHEKFDKKVNQPVPDWFVTMLYDFAVSRGATGRTDSVFRLGRNEDGSRGDAITSRRLDYIFQRLQVACAWADRDEVTAHTIRHHATALVERHAGRQVAAVFDRHEPEDTTGLYGRASREGVASSARCFELAASPYSDRSHCTTSDRSDSPLTCSAFARNQMSTKISVALWATSQPGSGRHERPSNVHR